MIDGKVLMIGDQKFIVPAINFKGVKKIEELLKRLGSIPAAGGFLRIDQIDILTEIVLVGLSRNYPDLTKQQLEEILDMNNIQTVLEAVTAQAGFKKVIQSPRCRKPDEQSEEEFARGLTAPGKLMGNT